MSTPARGPLAVSRHAQILDALARALAHGADPAVRDSAGATPLHALNDRSDHLNPGMARALVGAGVRAIDVREPSLEDAFLGATGRTFADAAAESAAAGSGSENGGSSVITSARMSPSAWTSVQGPVREKATCSGAA